MERDCGPWMGRHRSWLTRQAPCVTLPLSIRVLVLVGVLEARVPSLPSLDSTRRWITNFTPWLADLRSLTLLHRAYDCAAVLGAGMLIIDPFAYCASIEVLAGIGSGGCGDRI